MLHIATPDGNIHIYSQPGVGFKPTKLCPAPCCDIDCQTCSELADCPHSDHGNGGFCVFQAVAPDEFTCLYHYPQIIGYSECICTGETNCVHVDHLHKEAQKRKPGSRKAGGQKVRYLEARRAAITSDSDPNAVIPTVSGGDTKILIPEVLR